MKLITHEVHYIVMTFMPKSGSAKKKPLEGWLECQSFIAGLNADENIKDKQIHILDEPYEIEDK